MSETDEVNEQVGRSLSTAAMVAARVAEPLARAVAERQHRSAEQAAERSREVLARFEAERALVRAELEPIAQNFDAWSQQATARDAVELHRVASQWREHDDAASYVAHAVETRAPERFGLRTMTELEARADVELAREDLAARRLEDVAAQAGTGAAAESEAARDRREQAERTAEAAALLQDADRAEREAHTGREPDASSDMLRAEAGIAARASDRAGVRADVAEDEVSADRERQARIEQSVDGIDLEGTRARTVAARGNAYPPKAAAAAPQATPRARKARSGRGVQRQATLGR